MIPPALPDNETERLAYLHDLYVLDTPTDLAFEQLIELTAQLLQVPIVLISLIDEHRQWFKAKVGVDVCETGRDISFCGHVVADNAALIVEDATKDARFADNTLVTADPHIRFYAGIPLGLNTESEAPVTLGTLCIIDKQPRKLTEQQLQQLQILAKQAEQLLVLHQQRLLLSRQGMLSDYRLARYDAITKGAAAGIVLIDGQGIIQEINDYALALLGYERRELLGENVKRLMPAQWAEHHDGYLKNYIASGKANIIGKGRRVAALHKQGRHIPVHLAVEQVHDRHYPEKIEFIGILTDLTEEFEAEQREREEHALLRSIIDASRDPIFAKNTAGEYLIVNRAFLAIVPERGPEQKIDEECVESLFGKELMQQAKACEQRVINSGQPETLSLHLSPDQHFDVTNSPLKDSSGNIRGVVGVTHNVSDLWRTSAELKKQQQLLSVLHRGLTDYHALMSGNQLWPFLQEALRELTASSYSLIGEVLHEPTHPVLKIHAITDLSWNPETRELMQKLQAGEMTLTNPGSMLGQVFAEGKVVLSNNMAQDERSRAFPHGHPPLHNYLGVPIMDDGDVIGMYAIANGQQDYSDELVTWLEPFTSTCALLIKLYRQLNEHERFTEQLRSARDIAEQASRAKSDFLSSMSHELRTPLNAIIGFAQLLQSNTRTPLTSRQERQVEQIYKSGHYLLGLINEVLDLACIEAGHINISLEPLAIVEVLQDACDSLMPIARQYDVQLAVNASITDAPGVMADYTRLKQVIINLVSNAIKYNRQQGRVDIFCARQGEQLKISVKDTGFGINPDYLDQLFQPFNRLDVESGAIEGTGVGLALTKSIVEQMGGQIGLENSPDIGCEFWFLLPLAAMESQAEQDELLPVTRVVEPQKTAPARAVQRVLYVEDNPANQRLMTAMFEERAYVRLECVHSAELAFELACSHPPSLILMDIHLPGMSGIDAAKLFRRHPLTCGIPMVALSADALPEDIKRASAAGFKDYLTKPIDIARLFGVVDQLLEWPDNA